MYDSPDRDEGDSDRERERKTRQNREREKDGQDRSQPELQWKKQTHIYSNWINVHK